MLTPYNDLQKKRLKAIDHPFVVEFTLRNVIYAIIGVIACIGLMIR